MKLKAITAVILAAAAFSASAENQTFSIVEGTALNFTGLNNLLSSPDHSDTLTFEGLAAGSYKTYLSFSSVNLHITKATLNGLDATYLFPDGFTSIGYFNLTTTSPLELKLYGTLTDNPSSASYSGQLVVTAVPEPETYGMLLGGMALLGVVARRRKQR
ncbi:conserved hypothetical protein [Ricinus communis]|uniref:Ice-binding protein C-terminal domain-containing protein n=1 Tax=Ricinus communis TaxID=3988 RepID=B9TKR1_RICCO|nr:conserved hypothetical protein [Ricinus communis]